MLLVVQVAEGFEVPAWALTSPPHSTDELAVRVDRATRPHVDGAAAPAADPPLISVMVPPVDRLRIELLVPILHPEHRLQQVLRR